MIELKNISKNYSSSINLKDISINIQSSKITTILAPVKSGKSLLLKIIAGLEEPASGEVVNQRSEEIMYIPSEPSSFPWFNVHDNIKLGLPRWDEGVIRSLITLVGLEGYDLFFPDNKSLGFRFRISLARALANNPGLILLDEPFSKMDDRTRSEMYRLLFEINKTKGITFLLATSNVTETILLSNHIYLMNNNPAEIISETEVDLSDSDRESGYSSEKFCKIKTQIENEFKNSTAKQQFTLFF